MGYVHDTQMSHFIPPNMFATPVGTWTLAEASNLITLAKTAGDEAFTTLIPIRIEGNAAALKGLLLKSIDVWYKISTAAADDFATVELEKVTFTDAAAPTGAAVTVTLDTLHDTAGKRKANNLVGKMTITLTTPEWVDQNVAFYLKLVVDCAATTVFTFYGARANYTLRV
jgi:hypothetical protein